MMMGGSGGMSGMMMGDGPGASGKGSAGANPDDTSFTKYADPTVMIRSLDFTVNPDTSYRYHVRIVVVNPNKDHTDVNPGVDIESKELLGPWSDPTEPITIPADVVPYAQAPDPPTRRDDLVLFQVIKWDPAKGQTVIKNDIAGPGDIVGEYGTVPVPDVDGGGVKQAQIDFNSRSVVLDTYGGRQRLPDIGVERNLFEVPAVAMLIEPDGSVVIRSQAIDRADAVRKDMDANNKLGLEDAAKKNGRMGGSMRPGSRNANSKKRGKR